MKIDDDPDLRHQYSVLKYVAAEKKKCNDRLKELEEVESDAKAEIQDALGLDTEATLNGAPVVKWSRFTTRRFNAKALLKSYPDVHAEFYETHEQRRFEVIVPEEES